MGIGALAAGSVVSGLISSNASSRAADAASDASEANIAESARQFDLMRADTAGTRFHGNNAQNAQASMLGLPQYTAAPSDVPEIQEIITQAPQMRPQFQGWNDGNPNGLVQPQPEMGTGPGAATSTFRVGDATFDTRDAAQSYVNTLGQATTEAEPYEFTASPGYQFRLNEGLNALTSQANARGMSLSGASLQEAQRYGEGLAADDYWTQFNALGSLSGAGQVAVNNSASLGAQMANSNSQNRIYAANAQGTAYQNQANAFGGTLNNLATLGGYAQSGMFGANPGFGITPSPAGLAAYGY